MSKVKTKVEAVTVQAFLEELFSSGSIENIVSVKGGEVSQAFSFKHKNKSYIIKVRKLRKNQFHENPFQKELKAYQYITLRDSSIPIPKVLRFGPFPTKHKDKYLYCINEKMAGSFIHTIPPNKRESADEQLIKLLGKIHTIDISSTRGFGHWSNFTTPTEYTSWQEFLLKQIEREEPIIEQAAKEKLADLSVTFEAKNRISQLLPYCSTRRYLVHADYGYDNVLATESSGAITAVFDWEHSLFGDFIYDIAWLDLWRFREEGTYERLYKKHNNNSKLDYNNFDQRLLCYKLFIGIQAASFFIESEQHNNLSSAIKVLRELLEK